MFHVRLAYLFWLLSLRFMESYNKRTHTFAFNHEISNFTLFNLHENINIIATKG